MQSIKSTVRWSPPLSENTEPCPELSNAVKRLKIRKLLCQRLGSSLESMYIEWGDKPDIKKNLFTINSSNQTYPKYDVDIQKWKEVIRDYCEWHEISGLDDIVNLWCAIVDVFISCPDFDTQVNAPFRAWVYGCMCKFILEQRKHKQKLKIVNHEGEEYDPNKPRY